MPPHTHGRLLFSAIGIFTIFTYAPVAAAQAPSPAPSATPAASASAMPAMATDPCASLLALVTRPTVTTSGCSVKPGQTLIETGYTNQTTSGAGGGVMVTYPQAEVRIGLPRKWEFDVFVPSWNKTAMAPATSGPGDASAGVKYEFGYTSRLLTGADVVATVPTGAAPFTGGGPSYAYDVNAAYTLSPNVGLSATAGYNSVSAPGPTGAIERFGTFSPSLVLADMLGRNFQVFAEAYGSTTAGPGLGGRYGVDVGLQKDVGSRLQLDVEYGDTLTVIGGLHPHYVGFGAAYLFGR